MAAAAQALSQKQKEFWNYRKRNYFFAFGLLITPNLKINSIEAVDIIAMKYAPAPRASPTPATAHRLAAVVSPRTWFLSLNIVPAPRKPMPVIIPDAILVGSSGYI